MSKWWLISVPPTHGKAGGELKPEHMKMVSPEFGIVQGVLGAKNVVDPLPYETD